MIILSHEAEALARLLADAERVSVDAAVREALEARARAAGIASEAGRVPRSGAEAAEARRGRMERIAREIAAMPVLDPRSPQEIADDLSDP